MKKNSANRTAEKKTFTDALTAFVESLREHISTDDGQWTIKGFIDVYKNIYTISADTKIISKILEIHLFPRILKFAQDNGYSVVLAEHQNFYPDFSFVKIDDPSLKFAVDLKTTYRNPDFPGHVNGFTLGSHGEYFKERTSKKNIQFPYSEYAGHFCLGIIYSRAEVDESRVTPIEQLRSIASVVKDFQFFVCEKWKLASDRAGSGNTANIGSITCIEDIVAGRGVFSKLGESWFDEYWMNHGVTTMLKDGKATPIRNLEDFLDFKGGDKRKIVAIRSKTKTRKGTEECA